MGIRTRTFADTWTCACRLLFAIAAAAIGMSSARGQSTPPLPALPVTFVFSNCDVGVTYQASIADWVRDSSGNPSATKIVQGTTVTYSYLFWGAFTMTVGRSTQVATGSRLPDGSVGRPIGSLSIMYTNLGIDSIPPATSFLLQSSNANGLGVGTGAATSKLAWTASFYGAGNLMPNGLVSPLPPITAWTAVNTFIEGDAQLLARPITQYGPCKPEPNYKLLGDPVSCNCGDPINVATGNLFEKIIDYDLPGPNKLALIRYYNSLGGASTFATTLGAHWRSNYDRFLYIASPTAVTAERPDGQQVNFTLTAGAWKTDTDVDLALTISGTTWTLTGPDDSVETYRTAGANQALLQSIRMRNGYTLNLQYNGTNQLIAVTDSFRRALTFTYNGSLLQTVTTPDQQVFTYAYATSSAPPHLTSVAYSTSPATRQTYLYENTALPSALTGVMDENGDRYVTWTYDSSGRALSSQHAGGADLTRVAYNDADGSRTVTYPLGVQATFKFTVLQGVPKVTEIDRLATSTTAAAVTKFTYDSNGYMASRTDWNGVITNYVNDGRGQHLSVTEAAGTPQARMTTFEYHPTLHVPTRIVEPGLTTAFTYDAGGNVLTRTSTDTTTTSVPYATNGQTRTWTYTWSNSLLASIKKPRTDVAAITQYGYDSSGAPVSITNALGQVTKITQHLPGGLPQTILDANGVSTQLTYDARLRLHTRTVSTASGPLVTTYTFDAAGNLLRIAQPDGSGLANAYDAAHRPTGVSDNLGQRTVTTLDAQGNPTKSSVLDAKAVPQGTRSRKFDALGRLLQQTGGSGQVTTYAYDSNGNILTITDPLNRVTEQAFDPLNRLIKRTDPAKGVTAAVYDAHGRPLSITDANGATTSFVYNGFGDLIERVSPDSGTTVYYYDAGGNQMQSIDAAGAVVEYAYDALDRLTSINYPADPASAVTYTYDQATAGFGIGRLGSVTDAAGSLNRTYDERGNILSESRITAGVSLTTAYTYDAAHRIASITYPSGGVAAYTRDAAGRITAVTYQAPGGDPVPIVSGVGYQPFGLVNGLTYGNGVSETRSFDMDYRLTSLTDTGSAVLQSLVYSYDPAGNVSSIVDGVNPGASQTFGVDTLDRLTSATGSYGTLQYSYDPVGNRLTETGGSAVSYDYVPRSNQLRAMTADGVSQSIGYTGTGNLNAVVDASGPAGFTYNQAGRLASVMAGNDVIATYTYDVFGRRLVKLGAKSGTTLYQYDRAGRLLEETDDRGIAQADYIYLDWMPVATVAPAAGQIYFLHDDRLGAPQLATDSNQALVWIGSYTPFGELTTNPNLIVQNLRLPGQEYDSDTGLYHNGFRNYIPGLGRYLESDPIGLAAGMNTYAYAGGNPVNSIDPFGLADNLIFEKPGAHYDAYVNTPSIPGLYTVGGDANPDGLADENGHRISPQALAEMIINDPAYRPGETVRLDACRLGLGTYAQELANELHATVLAADNYVWSGDPHGPIVAPIDKLDSLVHLHPVPDLNSIGSWIEFKPQYSTGDFNQTPTPII